jgi:hypothetical protein
MNLIGRDGRTDGRDGRTDAQTTLKVTTPIPEGLSNSACFQVEAIHETIFNAFAIENHEFSKKN